MLSSICNDRFNALIVDRISTLIPARGFPLLVASFKLYMFANLFACLFFSVQLHRWY